MSEYVLALDLGSKCSAYAFGTDGEVYNYGKWVNKEDNDNKDHGMALLNFSKWLSRVVRKMPNNPSLVLIESPYAGPNMHTYLVLCKFLGVAEREIRRLAPKCEIKMIPARTVKAGLSVRKGGSHKENKVNMIKRINRLLGLDLKYHSNKNKTQDDIADAIALLLYHYKTSGE